MGEGILAYEWEWRGGGVFYTVLSSTVGALYRQMMLYRLGFIYHDHRCHHVNSWEDKERRFNRYYHYDCLFEFEGV